MNHSEAGTGNLLRFPAVVIAGSLAVGGFHPFELWFFPLVSLWIFIQLSRRQVLITRLTLGFLYGIGFLLPLLHWSSTYVGAVPWLILSIGYATFFSVLALGFKDGQVSVINFAAAFALSEGMRAIMPFGGFGWGRFGFAQLDGPFQEWLRIGGVSLTSFVLALCAALLSTWNRKLLLMLPLLTVGMVGVLPANAAMQEQSVKVGLIQGGVSQLGLQFNASPREVFDRHFTATEELLDRERVDLILWPENASDIDPITDIRIQSRLKQLAGEASTPLILGAVTQSSRGPENVSLMFDGGAEVVSRYQKRDLVPFGEYIPLRTLASRVSPLAETVKDFVPGTSIGVHSAAGLRFAPLICYEILDDRISWENLKVSNIGVVQTNNATFGRSWQSGQQFQMTRVRAFETQMPFIVAATTGDTASIDQNGEVEVRLEKYKSSSLVVDVSTREPMLPPVTPEWMLVFAALIIALDGSRRLLTRYRL